MINIVKKSIKIYESTDFNNKEDIINKFKQIKILQNDLDKFNLDSIYKDYYQFRLMIDGVKALFCINKLKIEISNFFYNIDFVLEVLINDKLLVSEVRLKFEIEEIKTFILYNKNKVKLLEEALKKEYKNVYKKNNKLAILIKEDNRIWEKIYSFYDENFMIITEATEIYDIGEIKILDKKYVLEKYPEKFI